MFIKLTPPVFKQFVEGGNLTEDEREHLGSIKWLKENDFVTGKKSFSDSVYQV